MLTVTIPACDKYDELSNTFITTKEQVLRLEHSLVSIAKWEIKWKKPFFGKGPKPEPKSYEENIDYIRCMTLTQNVDPMVYYGIPASVIKQIDDYINDPMTATTFKDEKSNSSSSEYITNELVYYWMFANQIPIECEKWHFNRLMTLIHIFANKNAPPKKMSKRDILNRNAKLNAERRKAHNTKG